MMPFGESFCIDADQTRLFAGAVLLQVEANFTLSTRVFRACGDESDQTHLWMGKSTLNANWDWSPPPLVQRQSKAGLTFTLPGVQ